MSDLPEKINGWHTPENPNAWRSMVRPKSRPRRRFGPPTLAVNIAAVAPRAGVWHLPVGSETTARPVPTGPRPEDLVPEPPAAEEPTVVGAPPEEAVPDAPKPEEAVPAAPKPEESVPVATGPRPEDLVPEEPRPEEMDLASELDDVYSAALDELEDDDEEAFQMSELMALQSLADAEPSGDVSQGVAAELEVEESSEDEGEMDISSLSPAERAAMGLEPKQSGGFDYASQIAALQGEGEAPAAESEQQPGGFDYASQIAALQGEGGESLQYSQGQPPVTGEQQPGGFDYASQIAALQGDQGRDMGATEALGQTPVMDPEREALAQRFVQAEQQIRQLRQQRDMGLITQDQLESQLRELMVLDNENNWWMMGVDTEIWYRYDPNSGQWIVAEPPRTSGRTQPMSPSAVRTDTGSLDPNEVIRGTLPQVPYQEQTGGYTAPQNDPFGSAGLTPQTDYIPPREVPQRDLGATMVGTSAFRERLPGSETTVANMSPVQADMPEVYAEVEAPFDEGVETAPVYDEAGAYEGVVQRAEERRQRSLLMTILMAVGVLIGIGLITVAAVLLGGTMWYRSIADRWAGPVAAFGQQSVEDFKTVIIQDVSGEEIARLRSEQGGDRTNISLQEVSPYMIHAVVSTENERFFNDSGYDPIAIGRAFIQNLSGGEVLSGGSTITQQLARNIVFQGFEFRDEADRKLNEIVVASVLSRQYSKEQILEVYLNDVYFGNQKYGIEAAAEFYFDKPASELNLAESALLAGLIQAPAANDPVTNPVTAFNRMDQVTRRMAEVGCLPIPYQAQPLCITPDTLRGEAAVQIAQVKVKRYLPEQSGVTYPHFVTFVQQQLQQQFSQEEIFRRGFVVRTTLNPPIQDIAQQALEETIAGLTTTGVNTGTVMVTDVRTGAIRAMIGSPDFNDATIDGQVNLALSWQQPGSAIKPVVYTAALAGVQAEGGVRYYTPATIIWDVPVTYADGTPIRNFDNQFHGPQSARSALQNSYNIPAVKTYNFIGDAHFQQVATAMGLRFLPEAVFGPPTGVGATEVRLYDMMVAYGTIANDGNRVPLYAIESITDFQGNPVEFFNPQPVQGAITPQVAYLMQNILSDDAARQPAFGANNRLSFREYPSAVAAKTGTSSEARDLWTMGFTNDFVVGVWMGRVDNQPTFNTSGYLTASQVWNRVMREVLRRTPPGQFEPMSGVVARQICADTGTLTDANFPCNNVRNELFIDNQPPPTAAEGFLRRVELNTWNGLIANDFCPNDRQAVTVANITDPTAVAWLNSNTAGRAVAERLGLPIPVPSGAPGECDINTPILQAGITSPVEGTSITTPVVQVGGSISSAPSFASYDLQVASAQTPDQFQIVAGPFTSLPVANQLGTWDATNFPNGTYILRLAVNNQNGGYAYRTVTVNLNKPLPTATPTPPPVPTTPPIALPGNPGGGFDPTPLPFEGQAQGFGLPTPTATLDFGG